MRCTTHVTSDPWFLKTLFATSEIWFYLCKPQIVEVKRKAEEDARNNEALEEYKKKVARDMEAMSQQLEEARATNDRLEKSRKKLQAEVDDAQMEIDNQRSSVLNMDKKQRKFDALLAEEKAVSERWVSETFTRLWKKMTL